MAAPAEAHFTLQHPADALVTDETGDPAGANGTQKMNPCGQGTASGVVTEVHAGATLHVKLTEAIAHGGHYRIALLPKYDPVSSDIPEPAVTLQSGSCGVASVMSPVVPPVLADNLFPHDQLTAVDGQVWETDVTLPSTTGHATLQIIEFMTPHAPQCFYHHCAKLEIVSPDTDLGPTGELVLGPDAGATGTGDAGGSSSGDGGGSSGNNAAPSSSSGGCNTSGDAAPSGVLVAAALAALAVALARPRTRRRIRGA
jgi:hypothetical protein